ncbi:MAG: hypothetical protein RL272_944, partial [Candidatus Parcubacteria bacterium]
MPDTRQTISPCPLCGSTRGAVREIRTQESSGSRLCTAVDCEGCGLTYLSDYPDDRGALYDERYAAWGAAEGDELAVASSKRTAFARQLSGLTRHLDAGEKRLLDVGTGWGYLLDVAASAGFDVRGLDTSAAAAKKTSERFPGRVVARSLADARYADASFDVVTMTDVIEHVADPAGLIREVARVLRPGGHLFIITPDTDSLSHRLLGARWFQYKYEHVTYWNRKTLERLLAPFGFETVSARPNAKRFALSY